jgi:hypothetical protein
MKVVTLLVKADGACEGRKNASGVHERAIPSVERVFKGRESAFRGHENEFRVRGSACRSREVPYQSRA